MDGFRKIRLKLRLLFANRRIPDPTYDWEITQKMFDWVLKVQSGDDKAMTEFLKMAQYRFTLLGHGHSFAMEGKEETPDLVQESLVILYHRVLVQHFSDQNHLQRFINNILYGCQVNRVKRYFLTEKRNPNREVMGIVDQLADLRNIEPLAALIAEEDLGQLENALNVLNFREKTILNLRTQEGLTWQKIGQTVGISADGARKAYGRIVGILQVSMGVPVEVNWLPKKS